MSGFDVELWVFSRANERESVEEKHSEFSTAMSSLESPLGWFGLGLPAAPEFGESSYAAFGVKYPIRGLKFVGTYVNRLGLKSGEDSARADDFVRLGFKVPGKVLDYRAVLRDHFPRVIEAFRGYRAFCNFDQYLSAYYGGFHASETGFDAFGNLIERNETYNRLRREGVEVDGRRNIYALRPAQYWDTELCQRALGYGPEEVVTRLAGKVPKVEKLGDGVYVVFNDDPAMSYDDFLSLNERYKAILGLA
ncbi:hypothetical protein ABXT21_02160 [Ralstonia sp. SM1864_UCD524_TZ4]|uniref:Hypothethical protein n=1 Tax=Ralstonia solanacearum TaxID=305 RepID=A0A0S4UUN9_RALSL|nr:hypothetical protein [Ralstonia pseudosolanacearum]MCL1622084.1 hypothetical protein [Ralstonia pseudosolanacearum CaRs-Mep]CUV25884.1 Hypothethical protein [Ralstonia solanacearum]CUV35109.1 Hypothethical protein [Ralstonia solanacearum]CUV39073.1 Hypothethical protein [Ralstonia solanacearum]